MSFGEIASAARDTEWAIRSTDQVTDFFKRYDRSLPRVSEEDWQNLSDEYDEDQLEALLELVDEKATTHEWDNMLEEFSITNNARQTLDAQGMSGVGMQLGAAILDPTFLAAAGGSIFLGDKASGVILAANRGGRIARLSARAAELGFTAGAGRTRLARVLGETALADGAVMGIRSQTTADYSDADMTIDMLASLAIVGAMDTALARSASRASRKMEEGRTAQLLGEDLVEEVDAGLGGSVGAAKAKGDAGPLRADDFAVFANSENPEMRRFAEDALQDAVGGGSESAAVIAARSREHFVAEMNSEFYRLWKGHKKTLPTTGSPLDEAREMQKLSERVWEAVVLDADHGPEIAKVAEVIKRQNDEIFKGANKSGMNGFDLENQQFNYMRQEWDAHGWRKAMLGNDALDEDELVELIHRGLNGFDEVPLAQQLDEAKVALRDHQYNSPVKKQEGFENAADEVGEQLAKDVEELEAFIDARKRLAMGFTRRMLNRSDGDARPLEQLMDDQDSLVKWLREDEEFRTTSEDDLKAIVQKALSTRSNQSKRNVVDRAKRRIQIDPAAEYVKGGRTHRVADLMRRDAMGLQQSYIHEMTGNIAFARKLGIKGPADWENFKTQVKFKELEIHRASPEAESKASKALEQLEEMKREIYGHNRFDLTSNAARWASALMKYNFMTTMGKAAFSATSEFGRILAENRVRNVLKVIPSLHKLITDSFRNVNKNSHIIQEVNSFNASIGDEHLLRFFNSFDETGVREGTLSNGLLSKTEIVMHRGARLMAKASLLAPMDKMLRLVSFQSSMNSLYAHLMKGQKARLAFDEMGMTKGLRERIKANMSRHGVETDAWGNVTKLNIHLWDRKTADEMMNAMTVNGGRQVQKTLAGENTWITSHPWGRVFLQFRKFAIDAYVKHLRADIRSARNGQALRVMMSNMYAAILAAAGYTARTHTSTVGMSEHDREKYLKERLAGDRLAANIAAYTPAVGVGVSAWNTGPGWLFPDAVVPVMRSSGLDNKGIGSNPTGAALDRVGALFHDVGGTEAEDIFDKGRFGIPFQNTIWGDVIINNAARATK